MRKEYLAIPLTRFAGDNQPSDVSTSNEKRTSDSQCNILIKCSSKIEGNPMKTIPIEMYISVMAGCVLAFFLMVSEVVALRKQARKILAHLQLMFNTGKKVRLLVEICGIAVFFLIQPVIVAVLVVLALNDFNPHFSANLMQELKQVF